jgi:hypothetical protein
MECILQKIVNSSSGGGGNGGSGPLSSEERKRISRMQEHIVEEAATCARDGAPESQWIHKVILPLLNFSLEKGNLRKRLFIYAV